jgi:hypothetical protein
VTCALALGQYPILNEPVWRHLGNPLWPRESFMAFGFIGATILVASFNAFSLEVVGVGLFGPCGLVLALPTAHKTERAQFLTDEVSPCSTSSD